MIKSGVNNMLTFDIEEWFHANYDDIVTPADGKPSHFRYCMDTLLEICRKTDCKATFFVLGYIGEHYPDVVKAILREGHEVASHGYAHQLAYKQTYEQFKADVKKSVDILEHITGVKVIGYRAPSWSIVESNLHYLQALEELGLKYDASIFPVKTFLYGIPTAPTEIHKPRVGGKELGIYEVPMSVMQMAGKNIGYSGGFYFRFFPELWIKNVIRTANRQGKSSIVYLHPREVDPTEQKLSLPFKEHFIHYYNVRGTKSKLERILRSFEFTSIAEQLKTRYNLEV
ncbi:polysaccharide deacetylase family protein [Paenibacillus hamazuiensis]|uniref:polysaccharide deacetylase family protein n=1 Tax=Paenibacillus hamazuiensis TaxID=2936508 RepID=UPI00200BA9EE|nr:polysaccharide deacetylase family protein [Paenibacillus hamazuiensis]